MTLENSELIITNEYKKPPDIKVSGGFQAVYKVFFIYRYTVRCFRLPGDAFLAGRLQLIPFSLRLCGVVLALIRPGVAPCALQLRVKRQSSICLLIKKTPSDLPSLHLFK
jgi:hypothetical protein